MKARRTSDAVISSENMSISSDDLNLSISVVINAKEFYVNLGNVVISNATKCHGQVHRTNVLIRTRETYSNTLR